MSRVDPVKDSPKIRRFLWNEVKPHFRWVVLSAIFALGAALVQIQSAATVKRFIDDALIPKSWDKVVYICVFIVCLVLFDGVTDFFHRFFLRIAVERTVRDLRKKVFERFLIFSQDQMQNFSSGAIVNHIVMDVFNVSLGLFLLADVIREPIVMVGLLGYLFYLNWKLTLVCLFAIPLVAIIGRALGKSAKRNQTRYQDSLDHVSNHVLESIGGLRTAHSFGQTAQLNVEFGEKNSKTYNFLIRLARIEELVNPLSKWAASWAAAALIGFGGYLVAQGKMSTGDILAFITAAGLLQQPMRQLNNMNVRLQKVIAAGARVYDIVNYELDDLARSQARNLHRFPSPHRLEASAPLLEFKNLGFEYPADAANEKRGWALSDINLRIEAGQRVALVGRSGSGKSTLSLLAMRFLDPQKGGVLLNHKNARDWDLALYREYFSYVSQDVFLFARSLRDNMLIARPGASEAEIWSALEKAHIRDFVESLPGKLDSQIGERAASLSGGEKQRFSIARAFLKAAPILVLDEATSQLDAHSEKAIQEAMIDLMKNRSVLIIAHRLSTIREADQVAVMEHGRLIELGSPPLLLDQPQSHFAKLWQAQSRS